ncbi:hypothetical protein SEPCBS57363_005012 [Sporothrix epigloea]|uniref:Peroxisomal membrane protein PEX14 n=1 Tax=Sporothrix epigloea TaxID=1892477 RepID=A0ABP0DY23_9PEZI
MNDSEPKNGQVSSRSLEEAPTVPNTDCAEDIESSQDKPTPTETTGESFVESEATDVPSTSTERPEPNIEQARVFLSDASVQRESRPRKAAFLASKGLTSAQIDQLLAEEEANVASSTTETPAPSRISSASAEQAPTLPPIVTYPEFMARPPRPPPLVTPTVFLGALYSSAAVSSLLYATARLVLAPMVDTLTESRGELHDTAASNLSRLLDKLEKTVSKVPEAAKAGPGGAAARSLLAGMSASVEVDDDSHSTTDSTDSYADPTEVFHRDIGIQTSLPPSPAIAPNITMDSTVPLLSTSLASAAASSTEKPSQSSFQAERLSSLVDSARGLSQGCLDLGDLLSDIQTTVNVFREDVEKLSHPPAYAHGGGLGSGMYGYGSSVSMPGSNKYPGYVTTTRNEPNDEIRKAKENIRRVKGALLTTRTFPTARRENFV